MKPLKHVKLTFSVCLLVRSPRPHSIIIIVWWRSLPRAQAKLVSRLCPYFQVSFFPVGDGLVTSFYPLQDSSGFLALQNILSVSSLFLSYLPPLRPFLCIQPTPSSVWSPNRPSPIVRPSESYQPSRYRLTNGIS